MTASTTARLPRAAQKARHAPPAPRLVALTLAALMGLSACGDKGATPPEGAASASAAASQAQAKPSLTVELIRAEQADWPMTVSAHGTVAPWQEAVVGAEVSGLKVLEVLVNVGETVRQGQVLATLRKDALGSEVTATRSQWVEAVAVLAEARSNAERARKLRQSDAISITDAQRAFTAEQQALARVDTLKAQLSGSEIRMGQAQVLAPDDGVISARAATVGTVAAPGQEMFRLIRQSRLEWRAEVPSTDLLRIRPGMPVALSAAGGPSVAGKVRMVAPTVDPSTRNGLVYVDLPTAAAQGAGVRAGMFARGEFDVGMAQGLSLPQTAVLLRDGYSYVMRVGDIKSASTGSTGRVIETKVKLGRRQGERVEVIDGLAPGAAVIASGLGFLTDGDTVRVATPTAKQ